MKRIFLAGIAVCALAAGPARAGIFDGWLADCTAVTASSCTEITTSGYFRQAIRFNGLAAGVIVSASPWSFASAGTGGATLAGRAIYDAPTGGNLLAIIPLATPLAVPSIGDRSDVGGIQFTIPGYTTALNADVIAGKWVAGATIGTAKDGSTVTAGVAESVIRVGSQAYVGAVDQFYSVGNVEVTGFSVTVPNGTGTFGIGGAGTLGTGTIVLQAGPTDGAHQHIFCDVTVTALTITPPATWAFVGTAPATCGPNVSHELEYFVAAKLVRVLY